jgi:hypothetical protein
VLDALKGVQKYHEARHGKSPARSIGLLEQDLQDQQKEYLSYHDPNLPVTDSFDFKAPEIPAIDPATVANTQLYKGNHSSYKHPLSRSKNVHPQQLNFGVQNVSSPQSDPVSPVRNPPSSVPQLPMKDRLSTGHYPHLALMSQYIE